MPDLHEAKIRHALHYARTLRGREELYSRLNNNMGQAIELLEKDWRNIQAAQEWCEQEASSDDRVARLCSDYPEAGARLLDTRLPPEVRMRWRGAALKAARQLKDMVAQAAHSGNLGLAYVDAGRPREAIKLHRESLAIARKLGDLKGQSAELSALGTVYFELGHSRRAIKYYEESLAIDRNTEDLLDEATALCNLGMCHNALADYQQALECYHKALTISRKTGNLLSEGRTLGNLGSTYATLGELNRARECHEKSLAIARRTKDRRGEISALGNLGVFFYMGGKARQAIELFNTQAVISKEIPTKQTTSSQICWLHVSDSHFGGSESNRYDENIVIESLLEDVAERIEVDDLRPDFIAVTGDLARKGKPEEYELVRGFFDQLLKVTGLPRERLFVVPGNHDVDRDLITRGALAISKELTDRQTTNMILASPDDRRLLLARFKGYSDFVNDYFEGHLVFDHERFFYVHHLDIGGRRLAILGLNSSWLAASDEDEVLKLVIGERQTIAALNAAKGASADLKIALVHHPDTWIRGFDLGDSMTRLINKCDFILHGHLHKAATNYLATPDGAAIIIAGGACYDTREHPNSYNFVKFDTESGVGAIHFREYVDQQGGFWTKGVRLYKNVPDGIHEFTLPRNRRGAI